MANEQYAFIQKDRVPTRAQWQEAVTAAGFKLEIDPDLQVFEHAGFLPCQLMGKESGVEMYYSSADEVFDDPADTDALAGGRDYCIAFRWGGSFQEGACAMILSYVLASSFDAVVSYEGDDAYQDLAVLKRETDEMVSEAAKEAED